MVCFFYIYSFPYQSTTASNGCRINRAKDGNYNHSHSPGKLESKLRLTGAERLLCAFPQNEDANLMFSPGLEKKTQAYLNFVAKPPSEKCEFIAYDDEDDDEANRPVM